VYDGESSVESLWGLRELKKDIMYKCRLWVVVSVCSLVGCDADSTMAGPGYSNLGTNDNSGSAVRKIQLARTGWYRWSDAVARFYCMLGLRAST